MANAINGIGGLSGVSIDSVQSLTKKPVEANSTTFDKFYEAALDVIDETNTYQRVADQLQLDLATGKTDDILAVMMAQEKAYSSLNFTLQVTNKIVEAYREIMRMQL